MTTSPATQEPCPACGYNGAGFYQSATHPCAESFHRTGRWKKPSSAKKLLENQSVGLSARIASERLNKAGVTVGADLVGKKHQLSRSAKALPKDFIRRIAGVDK